MHFSSLSITSDGFKAFSGSADGSFRVWDLGTSAHLKQDRSRGHSKSVIDIAVTHDGSRCVSASLDDTFKVWKCESAEEGCFTLRGINKIVYLSQFSSSTVTKFYVFF